MPNKALVFHQLTQFDCPKGVLNKKKTEKQQPVNIPVIYFLLPTDENVNLIKKHASAGIFTRSTVHFAYPADNSKSGALRSLNNLTVSEALNVSYLTFFDTVLDFNRPGVLQEYAKNDNFSADVSDFVFSAIQAMKGLAVKPKKIYYEMYLHWGGIK